MHFGNLRTEIPFLTRIRHISINYTVQCVLNIPVNKDHLSIKTTLIQRNQSDDNKKDVVNWFGCIYFFCEMTIICTYIYTQKRTFESFVD